MFQIHGPVIPLLPDRYELAPHKLAFNIFFKNILPTKMCKKRQNCIK